MGCGCGNRLEDIDPLVGELREVEPLKGILVGEFLRGYSAYKIAQINGFTGTEQEWLLSLKGEKGDKGDPGDVGQKGDKGDKGDTGEQGPKGDQGIQGDKGDKGDTGERGLQGEKGDKGDKGDTPVIASSKENGVTTVTSDGVTIAVLHDGDKGDKGDQGIQGLKGDTGDKGDKGDTPVITSTKNAGVTTLFSDGTQIAVINDGAKGDKGDKGEQGVQGLKGDTPVITSIKTDNVTAVFADGTQIATILDGEKGEDYTLTATDKQDIASLVVGMEIDDAAGDGDTCKTWSADKITDELANAGTVKDVTVDGTSIVDSNGEAVIPLGGANGYGVVKTNTNYGVSVHSTGALYVYGSSSSGVKDGLNSYRPITPVRQHESTFYGLAKASGDTTQSVSDNPVGTYTDNAKSSIKQMLGIPVSSYDLNTGTAITASADLNTYTASGVYHADSSVISTVTNAPTITDQYKLVVETIGENAVKQTVTATDGKTYTRTGASTNDIWTFSSWVNIITSTNYADFVNAGVGKIGTDFGISMVSNGSRFAIYKANSNDIKAGASNYRPIVPSNQHESTFYGLAKASGDTTQSKSNNAVGTYTDEAKQSIRTMLGISNEAVPYELTEEDKSDISDAVYESLVNVVTVSGTDPTITAEENTRYICGELLSLSFTPCQSGICDIRFTSGSTLTVLTLPSTVKLPDWFEVETNHTYEISIMDGVYGTVTSWSI